MNTPEPVNLQALNDRFAIAGLARLVPGKGGLPCVAVSSPRATATVYLHGAHVAQWQPPGQTEVLWLSEKSWFEDGKPIRGGVPICFPWFGPKADDPDAPAHGLARIRPWNLTNLARTADGDVVIELANRIDDWACLYTVTVGSTLTLSLHVTNGSDSRQPRRFELALHTYLSVSDAAQVSITGLEDADCLDKNAGGARVNLGADPIRFTGETDRIYLDTQAACVLHDPGPRNAPHLGRRVVIDKSGSDATVVWNPWIDKAARMPDFGDHEWPGMCCIETANVGPCAVTLPPGQAHAITAQLSVQSP
jgi:D-hexose-6-phosphate mutarotase